MEGSPSTEVTVDVTLKELTLKMYYCVCARSNVSECVRAGQNPQLLFFVFSYAQTNPVEECTNVDPINLMDRSRHNRQRLMQQQNRTEAEIYSSY